MGSILDLLSRRLWISLGSPRRKSPVVQLTDRKATLLNDVQRRIGMYLQALWGADFVICPAGGEDAGGAPYVEDFFIHLPAALHDFSYVEGATVTGLEAYRAAAAHAAAHIVFSRQHFPPESLNRLEKALVAVIEDARVETLAMRQLPGLKKLWCMQHGITPLHSQNAGDYFDRLARALLDETYQDDDPWVAQGRALFAAATDLENHDASRDIGLELARTFRQKNIRFNHHTDVLSAPYRDDNRYLWVPANLEPEVQDVMVKVEAPVKLFLDSNEVEGTDDDAQPPPMHVPILAAAASDTYVYPEWDYRGQIETQSWVTLREREPVHGDLHRIENIITRNKHLITRMNHLMQAVLYKGAHRLRKLEEGDEIDINAAIRTMVDIKLYLPYDTRVMMSTHRKTRDISVMVLLDLSYSTNQQVFGQDYTILQLTQEVCILFSEALNMIGDPLAINGFNSRGRHDVDYYRFKDFDQPYDDTVKSRIAGMEGKRSTRIGAAIRHATRYLNQQKSAKKLLMIITDGKPWDIDQPDPRYLCFDGKHAVVDARRDGIHSYCITLDPDADEYITRIFGAKNYIVVDHVRNLPEKMLQIYAALSL